MRFARVLQQSAVIGPIARHQLHAGRALDEYREHRGFLDVAAGGELPMMRKQVARLVPILVMISPSSSRSARPATPRKCDSS
jgi:hypothetical protein